MSPSGHAPRAAAPALRPCPQCGTPVVWGPDATFRPFCSERCKLIDFGAWATESYRVPVEEQDPDRSDEGPQG